MYNYKHRHRHPQYELNDEYEFNYESGSNYEMIPGLEINDETEPEYTGEYESSSPGDKDELEAELEFVTNEEEFGNWVNEIVVRDHRSKSLQPVLRRPIGQQAVRHLSHIASRTLPFLGARRGGWRGRRRRPGSRRWFGGQRPFWNNSFNSNLFDPSQQTSNFNDQTSIPQQTDQDGSFRNFVLGTLQNLSQQVASGNDTVEALKSSLTSSAASNLPALVQPAGNPGAAPAAQGAPAPATGEFESYESYLGEGEIADNESSFTEETEMDLASDLLAVKNESELDTVLKNIYTKAVGPVLGTGPGGQEGFLSGLLKSVVKTALPIVGGAAGTVIGGPIGTAIGGKIGSTASDLFELELEGLSNEDSEFETARAFVRFAGNAARQVADNQTDNPQEDVRHGVTEAAARYAPGLLVNKHAGHHGHHGHHRHRGHHGHHGHHHGHRPHSGTWYRKGDKIIIENI